MSCALQLEDKATQELRDESFPFALFALYDTHDKSHHHKNKILLFTQEKLASLIATCS
jgi:hypothetical protein